MNGSVAMEVQGEEADIDKMIMLIQRGFRNIASI